MLHLFITVNILLQMFPFTGNPPIIAGCGNSTFVNAISNGTTSGISIATVTPTSASSGNAIIVGVGMRQACGTVSFVVTDLALNSYTLIGSLADNAGLTCIGLYYAKNITGNANNIYTATANATVVGPWISANQVAGASISTPIDQIITPVFGVAPGTLTTGNFTPTCTTGLSLMFMETYNASPTISWIAGAGYTIPSGALDPVADRINAEYKASIGTGSQTASFNSGDSIQTLLGVTLK